MRHFLWWVAFLAMILSAIIFDSMIVLAFTVAPLVAWHIWLAVLETRP